MKMVHSTWEKRDILLSRKKNDSRPNIGQTSNDARIITLKLNPLRGTGLLPTQQRE